MVQLIAWSYRIRLFYKRFCFQVNSLNACLCASLCPDFEVLVIKCYLHILLLVFITLDNVKQRTMNFISLEIILTVSVLSNTRYLLVRPLFYLDACTFFRLYNRFYIKSSDSHDRPNCQKCYIRPISTK